MPIGLLASPLSPAATRKAGPSAAGSHKPWGACGSVQKRAALEGSNGDAEQVAAGASLAPALPPAGLGPPTITDTNQLLPAALPPCCPAALLPCRPAAVPPCPCRTLQSLLAFSTAAAAGRGIRSPRLWGRRRRLQRRLRRQRPELMPAGRRLQRSRQCAGMPPRQPHPPPSPWPQLQHSCLLQAASARPRRWSAAAWHSVASPAPPPCPARWPRPRRCWPPPPHCALLHR